MPIPIIDISQMERDKILELRETHFCDLKATLIKPAKLTRTIAALSNAEGGEVYIGVEEDKATRTNTWVGFNVPEDANAHLQVFESLFPLGEGYSYTFLRSAGNPGYVLKVDVSKSREVKSASDGKVFLRRGAQNLPVEAEEALTRLRRTRVLRRLKRSQ
jgi:ATP-dependent DNA helicase RecG